MIPQEKIEEVIRHLVKAQEKIEEAIQRLVKAYEPLEIHVHGRYAWGVPYEDDDLDLLIIIESSDQKVYKRGDLAFDALLGLGIPRNVAVFTKEEFDRGCQDRYSFAYEVKTRGKIVYASEVTK